MPYVLGIDINGTNMSAAVSRAMGSSWSWPEVVWLDSQACTVPTVLHVLGSGSFTVGEPDRAMADGGRIARGFVHRIGDDVPLAVAGEPCLPQTLVALMTMWVIERMMAREGDHPEHIVLSHPAGWGPYRIQLLHEALCDIGLAGVELLPESAAVTEIHASRTHTGHLLGVYSLGNNDFSTSVVRRARPAGFEVLRSLAGVEPFGGEDFAQALADHVRDLLGREFGAKYLDDPQVKIAMLALKGECLRARERLTVVGETDVVLHLPEGPTRVPVTRTAFEELIRPTLRLTVDCMLRTVRSAGLQPSQLDGVLLVGGAARIPLVAELLAEEFPAPMTAETDHPLAAAAGAALAAGRTVSSPIASDYDMPAVASAYADGYEAEDFEAPRPPVRVTKLKLSRRRSAPGLVHARSFTLFS